MRYRGIKINDNILWKGKDGNIKASVKKSIDTLADLLKKNNHKLIGEYNGCAGKITIKYNCEHEAQELLLKNYRNNSKCRMCFNSTPEQAKEKFFKLVSENNHEIVNEYINTKTCVLIDFKCKHITQYITPEKYRFCSECKYCKQERKNLKVINFKNTVNEKNHKLLSEYKNFDTKVLIDFNCGHVPHYIKPRMYQEGFGCPKCSGLCPKQAKENFFVLLKENKHKLLSEYTNSTKKVLIKFNCEHEPQLIQPSYYKEISKRKNPPFCKECKPKNISSDKIIEFSELVSSKNHTLLTEYKGTKYKVQIDFNCGHEPHFITPALYKQGQGCPKCAGKRREDGENTLMKLLEEYGHTIPSDYEYKNAHTPILIDFNNGEEPQLLTLVSYKLKLKGKKFNSKRIINRELT